MIRRWLAALLLIILVATGCAPSGSDTPPSESAGPVSTNVPPDGAPAVDDAAAALAAALAAGDVSQVPMQSQAAAAQEEFATIYAGMDGALPQVTVDAISYLPDDNAAEVKLAQSLHIALEPWTFQTSARFKLVDGAWRLEWQPAILHDTLDARTRMRRVVTEPTRASINDKDGLALVEEMSLFEVGIDKSALESSEWETAAKNLATTLEIDADAYAAKVAGGGERQFVIAETLRQQDIPSGVAGVPGVHVNEIQRTVAPSDGFAASILGTVGTPTADMIEASDGVLAPDDVVGLSGLQSRYEEQLGGVSGVRVERVARAGQESPVEPETLFTQEESVGAPITLSLDRALQEKAEEALGSQEGIASLVAIDLSTGGIAAAANSHASGTYPYATFGKYAPGSTFKVASALAMVRKGATADSTVDCSPEHTVGTYTFRNYPGYSHTGEIKLSDAIAYSCNTAFTHASESMTGEELHSAAGSLGVGTDYDAGFASYFGTVETQNDIDLAASAIGQGQVTMSPLGMAAVAASVAKGETVIPWLVEGHQATSTATPLTTTEAGELQKMMAATVDRGTATMLQGVATGAKSGTAQFGQADALKTHAWMIAFNDQYAVAAFVEEGDSGGAVAAPLIKALLG